MSRSMVGLLAAVVLRYRWVDLRRLAARCGLRGKGPRPYRERDLAAQPTLLPS